MTRSADEEIMTETAEYRGWHAHALEALEFYRDHGGECMTPMDRLIYETLLAGVQEAANRHHQAVYAG